MELLGERPGGIILLRKQEEYQWAPQSAWQLF